MRNDVMETGCWTEIAPGRPEDAYPACALGDGRVLFLTPGTSTAGAMIYDGRVDRWYPAAKPAWCSDGEAAARCFEGWVVTAGGWVDGGPTDRCAIYDPSKDAWHEMPRMFEPRSGHEMVVAGGRLFVIGGHRASSLECHDSMWSWAPGEEWRELPRVPPDPSGFSRDYRARALNDGSVVVWSKYGAGAIHHWNNRRWNDLGHIDAGSAILPTHLGFLVIGGERDGQAHGEVRELVIQWLGNRWRSWPRLPMPRSSSQAFYLADGRIGVVGGIRHERVWRDNSTGGELDWEYRSFPQRWHNDPVRCTDMAVQRVGGWDSFSAPDFGSDCVIESLRDGRLLVLDRWDHQIWTPG
jgi:hypothetical protein